eukprot:g9459.t1
MSVIRAINVRLMKPMMIVTTVTIPIKMKDDHVMNETVAGHLGTIRYKPLDSEVPERIVNGGVELFAYESDGQNCMGDDKVRGGAPSFSSNIMGASRGSSYMRRVWEKQKQAVSDHCKTAAEFETEARICCPAPLSVPGAQMLYDKSDRPITKCHVPWARLGEGTSHEVRLVPAVEGFAATFRPTAVKAAHVTQFNPEGGRLVVCYRSDEHFAPFGANSLAAQIGSAEHDRLLKATPNALGRAAYHQGHSNGHPDIERRSCEELIDEKFVLGRILVQAFFGGGAVNKKIVERICERKDVGAEVLEGSTILNEVAPPAKKGKTAGAKEEAEQLASVGQGEQLPLPEGEKAAEQASSRNEGLRGPPPKPKDGPPLKPSRAGRERSDRWAAKTGSIATQAAGSLVVVGLLQFVFSRKPLKNTALHSKMADSAQKVEAQVPKVEEVPKEEAKATEAAPAAVEAAAPVAETKEAAKPAEETKQEDKTTEKKVEGEDDKVKCLGQEELKTGEKKEEEKAAVEEEKPAEAVAEKPAEVEEKKAEENKDESEEKDAKRRKIEGETAGAQAGGEEKAEEPAKAA